MMGHYFFTQTAAVYVGINLSSGYLFMTQHTLDGSQIGSALQKVGGKRVTERMWTHRLVYAGQGGKIFHNVKNHYPGQGPSAADTQEQVRLRSRFDIYVATVGKIEFNLMDRPARYRNEALLAALAGNPDETLVEEKVLHLERTQFRYTQTAAVHSLYHSPVALTFRQREVYHAYNAVYLGDRKYIRKMTAYLGGLKQFTGIVLAVSVQTQEPEQGLYSRYYAGLGSGSYTQVTHGSRKGVQVIQSDVLNR